MSIMQDEEKSAPPFLQLSINLDYSNSNIFFQTFIQDTLLMPDGKDEKGEINVAL